MAFWGNQVGSQRDKVLGSWGGEVSGLTLTLGRAGRRDRDLPLPQMVLPSLLVLPPGTMAPISPEVLNPVATLKL